MDRFSNFVIANSFLALLAFLYKKVSALRPFPFVKVVKAQSAGGPILITLVSKDTIAAGA